VRSLRHDERGWRFNLDVAVDFDVERDAFAWGGEAAAALWRHLEHLLRN